MSLCMTVTCDDGGMMEGEIHENVIPLLDLYQQQTCEVQSSVCGSKPSFSLLITEVCAVGL